MPDTNNLAPFAFLNSQREKMFRVAVLAFNTNQSASLKTRLQTYKHMSKRGKSQQARPWLLAHITESFEDDTCAKKREIYGIEGIEFDRTHFVYFRKITDPENPVEVSKTISKAQQIQQIHKRQPYLPTLDDPEKQKIL